MATTQNPFEMTDMQLQDAQNNQKQDPPWDDATNSQPDTEQQEAVQHNPVVDQNNELGVSISNAPVIDLPPVIDESPTGQPVFQNSQQPAIVTGVPSSMKDALMGAAQEITQPSSTPSSTSSAEDVINTPIENQVSSPNTPPMMTQQPIIPPVEQAAPQPSPGFDNFTNDRDNQKYKIFDLYWLWPDGGNNVSPMSISFNIDFDNLRFSFYQASNETFNSTSAELNSMSKQCTFNVYSEIAEQVLYIFDNPTWQVQNYERLFKRSSDWTPCVSGFFKDQSGIHIMCKCGENQYKYTLSGWQIVAFKRSLEFSVTESRTLKIAKFNH